MSETIEELKTCKACGSKKALEDFYFKKDRNNYSNKCKSCDANGVRIPKSKTHKKCKHCGEEKLMCEFNAAGKWLQPYCIECDNKRKKKFYLGKADEYKIKSKEKYNANKEDILKRQKEIRIEKNLLNPKPPRVYHKMDKEEQKRRKSISDKIYREKNLLKLKAKRKEYSLSDQGRMIANKWQQNQKTDIGFVTKKRLRGRVYAALNRGIKSESTAKLLGCSIDFFKDYFESLFTEGMSWERYLLGEIHIDHKKPCKLFNLADPEEQKKCFHYTNLQPLWEQDNLIKGTKY